MADGQILQPAETLVRNSRPNQPNESAEYRKARNALLVEEIELRRHVARVAAMRRALPPGGEVKGDYQFIGEASSVQGANPVGLSELFGDKDTLFVYNWMYGPKRARPCPMCTALLSCLDGNADHIRQRIALASSRSRRSNGRSPSRSSVAGRTCRSTPTSTASSARSITRSWTMGSTPRR